MKNLILAAIVGAALASGALLGQAKLADKALNEVQEAYSGANGEEPICLAQEDGGEAYIILNADKEAKTYSGIRVLVMLQVPFQVSARALNQRPDLKQVDCRTGQPLGK